MKRLRVTRCVCVGLCVCACARVRTPLCTYTQGYYCYWASTAAQQQECSSPDVYCPVSSGSPTPVSIGYFTNPERCAWRAAARRSHTNACVHVSDHLWPARVDRLPAIRDFQIICPAGWYCVEGIKYICARGLYGGVPGQVCVRCALDGLHCLHLCV